MIKVCNFSNTELDHFRSLQRISFEILESVGQALRGGETEKEVAHELVKRYRAAGARSFFHLPVVLFGERTALPGKWTIGKFFPKAKRLERGECVILDAAPIFDGYLVDTSFSCCIGRNDTHDQMMLHLSRYRDEVPAAVNRGDTFRSIANDVAKAMSQAGYEPVHAKHPGEVLGHRAIRIPKLPFSPRLQGFDAISIGWFKLKDGLATRRLGKRSPLWNAQAASDHPPHDGLWLVEPHAGRGPVGAKWEEILVIDGGQARWLDAEPPHVRQWAKIAER